MKNLMVYVNPRKDFDEESKILVKIQIDNSFDLGWEKEDILLATNFEYEYRGIKAFSVDDDSYYPLIPGSTKTLATVNLFKAGRIEREELYWLHDLDVYQLSSMSELELGLDGADMGLTDYGRMPRLNMGSIFFKNSASDIFSLIKEMMFKFRCSNENALMVLVTNNELWATIPSTLIGDRVVPANVPGTENISQRIKKINITYNFSCFNLRSCYALADKPLKVAHFHIFPKPVNPQNPKPEPIDFFIRGKNKLEIKLVPERLARIFENYGIK